MERRVIQGLVVLATLLALGTAGYRLIEGWSVVDSLYMTMITISTVGFREVAPLSGAGKVFTVVLILVGVGSLAFFAAKTTEALLDQRFFHSQRLKREVKKMKDHVIVCGYGRMGRTVVDLLAAQRVPVVVIEQSEAIGRLLAERNIPHLIGDATDDGHLDQAGLQRARALATVLPEDADNLFVTISARSANPRLTIIARSSFSKNDAKMMTAGATRVLNPYRHGGRLMAQQLLQPNVTEFIDLVSHWGDAGLGLEEVVVQPGSVLNGRTIEGAAIRQELDVILVAVHRVAGGLIFNPPAHLALEPKDVLIALGRTAQLARLAGIAGGSGTADQA